MPADLAAPSPLAACPLLQHRAAGENCETLPCYSGGIEAMLSSPATVHAHRED